PVGTKLWKQCSFGRRVETRYMERVAGGDWIVATYVWNESGTEATLAPAAGVPRAVAIDANTAHDIPGYYDCLACHHSRPNRVLGFNLLQLSKDRDPLAANAVAPDSTAHDLPRLIAASLVRGLPDSMRNAAPRIPAATATERAALGYLYGNCAGCHNRVGPLAYLDMSFDVPSRAMAWNLSTSASASSTDRGSHDVSADGESPIDPEGPVYEMPALATTVDRPTRVGGSHATVRIRPGDPQDSAVVERAGSRNPALQMPPLGTHRVDAAGMALLEQWIREMPTPSGPDTSMREVDLENAIPAAQLASSSEK
ncbi:MAG: hypothetical protein KC729_04845, partial [Candidatus Eisenbacteria bacterium]|nr:hypothetical protein [Candidatus Eisenbacteria bacterium]